MSATPKSVNYVLLLATPTENEGEFYVQPEFGGFTPEEALEILEQAITKLEHHVALDHLPMVRAEK